MRPFQCERCPRAFTQLCSLESHEVKLHGKKLRYAYKERRTKVYVCERCGHNASTAEQHAQHRRTAHPLGSALPLAAGARRTAAKSVAKPAASGRAKKKRPTAKKALTVAAGANLQPDAQLQQHPLAEPAIGAQFALHLQPPQSARLGGLLSVPTMNLLL